MDSLPLTAALLGKLFPIKGSDIERYYKHHLSDYEVRTQKEHATDWVLLPENIGEYLSIDETQLCEEVYTILSNYFINRATDASAESLNSKMKGFRAQLHGIADIPFFMYRICTIFG